MQDGKAASGGARAPAMHLAWNGGAALERVGRRVQATSTHPHLGAVVLIGVTLALVGLLVATLQQAFEVPPFPGSPSLGAAPH